MSAPAEPRLSSPVDVRSLPAAGREITVEAGAVDLAGLAERLGVPGIEAFSGTVRLLPAADGARATGRVEARLKRLCVASLEPMIETIAEDFDIRFSREAAAGEGTLDLAPDEEWPEPLENETVDVADLLIQQAVLAMDPYPRLPGAPSLAETFGKGAETSPFAVLKGAIARDGEPE